MLLGVMDVVMRMLGIILCHFLVIFRSWTLRLMKMMTWMFRIVNTNLPATRKLMLFGKTEVVVRMSWVIFCNLFTIS